MLSIACVADLSSFPKPCIYCQFDGDVAGDSGEAAQVVEEQAGDEPMPLSTEARFVVSEGGAEPLEAIFSTLSECALLNPDDDDDDDDDDGGGVFLDRRDHPRRHRRRRRAA
eukprot:COSAG01_NODE_898_length_12870_cov_27.573800_11_plen_112_part_00